MGVPAARALAPRGASRLLSRLRRARGHRPARSLSEEPLLSVVVPVYEVEDYLAECLDSLLGQTYAHLEIVLVDDGSTDRSAEIARAYAEQDQRVVVVRQDNAGLGAARNAGLARCTGELVTFADSDDTVPPRAYERMVRTLQRTGSDFAVGAIVRSHAGVERMRPWVRQVHQQRRLSVTVDEVPDLLFNVFACTKVFRRDFVDRIGLRFPVGMRYEDQVPITRAYFEATAFDVLTAVVYRWQVRDDRSSITQQKTQMQDLADRLSAQREVAAIVHDRGSVAVRRRWYVKTFRVDFLGYLKVAADADDDYWEVLQEALVSIANGAPTGLEDDLDLRVRWAVWLGREGHRDALRRLVRHEDFAGSQFPVVMADGALVADASILGEDAPLAPARLLRIRSVDLWLQPALEALDWSDPGRLGVRCVAAMPFVDPVRHPVRTTFTLIGPEGTSPMRVDTEVVPDEHANLVARRAHEDQTRASVRAEVDLAALVEASGDRPMTRWVLSVRTTALDLQAEAEIGARRDHGSAVVRGSAWVDGVLVSTAWSERHGLLVDVRRGAPVVLEAEVGPEGVDLLVGAAAAPGPLLVGEVEVPATVSPGPRAGTWAVRVAVHHQTDQTDQTDQTAQTALAGTVAVAGSDGEPVALAMLEDLEPGARGDGRVRLVSSGGRLVIEPDTPCLLVDSVRVVAPCLVLSGRTHRVTRGRVHLESSRARGPAAALEVGAGVFTVRVPAEAAPWGGPPGPLPYGAYRPVAELEGTRIPVLTGRLAVADDRRTATRSWSVEILSERGLRIRRGRKTDPTVSGRFAQTSLRARVYAAAVGGPRRPVALFECFDGSGAGDSPLALCRALQARDLDLDLVWSLTDPAVLPPAGTRAVLRESGDWYDLLGSARLLVNNNTFPAYFEKGADQVYVQTWHGTPLKRIGTDIVNPRLSTEHYLRRLLREAGLWDVLVSPNPFCSGVFRRAFDYRGELLELGRPAHDVLLGPAAEPLRRSVRAGLGIPADQTVLLYAPTWRDDASHGGKWEKVLHLDHARVTAARPDVTVLVRGHPNTVGRPAVPAGERVLDVTSYPDLSRLQLAADVLVTDYSAAMVEFAVADKPVVLLTPDLEAYRDRVRGLYLDLEEASPGPVVRTTDDVLSVLDQGDEWAVRRKQVRERLAPWDDGGVSGRLADHVIRRLAG